MEGTNIRPYGKKPTKTADQLYREGILKSKFGTQEEPQFDGYWEGVNIYYTFKSFTPEKFMAYSGDLLQLIYEEMLRYEDIFIYKSASIDIQLNFKSGRNKNERAPSRTYTCGKQTDSFTAIWGLGNRSANYTSGIHNFMEDKIENIKETLEQYKDAVDPNKPFKVLSLKVMLRNKLK